MKQFILPGDAAAGPLRLAGKDFHYLVRVRRYAAGDEIAAMSRDGRRFTMHFDSVESDHCDVMLVPGTDEGGEDGIRITLMPGITKGKKMDLTVRQAVEAGATAIWPLLTDHCQVRYRDEKDARGKTERWERIATEALQQCGGLRAAEIAVPRKLASAVEAWAGRGPILFLHEKQIGSKSFVSRLAEPMTEMAIIVGPEGGLSPAETGYLLERGAFPVHLGNRILRAETAALYGLAAVATIIREKSEWHPA